MWTRSCEGRELVKCSHLVIVLKHILTYYNYRWKRNCIINKYISGKVLLNAANKFLRIDDSEVIAGLSGRKNVVPVYIRSGYKNVTWDVLVYMGQVHLEKLTTTTLDAIDVVPVSSVKFEDLLKYDQCIHPGVKRSLYWEKCFAKKGAEYLVAVNDGNIVGICGCRPFTTERVYISPLNADSVDIAKVLIKALLQKLRPSSLQMEAIEPNSLIKELSAWLDVSVSYALARQYTSEEGFVSTTKSMQLQSPTYILCDGTTY